MKRLTSLAVIAVLALPLAGCVTVNRGGAPVESKSDVQTTDQDFLDALDKQNIESRIPLSDDDLVSLGKDICREMQEAGGAERFFRQTLAEAPNMIESDRDFIAGFAGVSAAYYCPEMSP